jgi:hypothetical protein
MALHYQAAGTRTLCGSLLSDRLELAPLWADFLKVYEYEPGRCCSRCLRACRGWQRFSKDIAEANLRRKRRNPPDELF